MLKTPKHEPPVMILGALVTNQHLPAGYIFHFFMVFTLNQIANQQTGDTTVQWTLLKPKRWRECCNFATFIYACVCVGVNASLKFINLFTTFDRFQLQSQCYLWFHIYSVYYPLHNCYCCCFWLFALLFTRSFDMWATPTNTASVCGAIAHWADGCLSATRQFALSCVHFKRCANSAAH